MECHYWVRPEMVRDPASSMLSDLAAPPESTAPSANKILLTNLKGLRMTGSKARSYLFNLQ